MYNFNAVSLKSIFVPKILFSFSFLFHQKAIFCLSAVFVAEQTAAQRLHAFLLTGTHTFLTELLVASGAPPTPAGWPPTVLGSVWLELVETVSSVIL